MSGPVTSVVRVEDVQIFLKDPVYIYVCVCVCVYVYVYSCSAFVMFSTHFWRKGFLQCGYSMANVCKVPGNACL